MEIEIGKKVCIVNEKTQDIESAMITDFNSEVIKVDSMRGERIFKRSTLRELTFHNQNAILSELTKVYIEKLYKKSIINKFERLVVKCRKLKDISTLEKIIVSMSEIISPSRKTRGGN